MQTEGQSNEAVQLLLVEDSKPDIDLIRQALRGLDTRFSLSVVLDGNDALDYLFQRGRHTTALRPALIVLDVNLPGKTGHEVLQELKGSPELRTIPVVMFSSSRAPRDVRRSYELAANCYVQKPMDLDEFFGAVQDIEHFWLSRAVL